MNISDEFDVDLAITIVTFRPRSSSTFLLVQQLCKEGLDPLEILHMNISDKFDFSFSDLSTKSMSTCWHEYIL